MTESLSDERLSDIYSEFEKYQIILNEHRYNQIAGLEYDRSKMESASETLVTLSSEFLKNYKEPRPFFLSCISSISVLMHY